VRLRQALYRLFGIDSRALAAFRMGIGALVLVDLWTRSSALEQHYSDSGILPREAYARLLSVSDWQWSVHLWAGSAAAQLVLFLVAAVAACALVAGYRTRAAAVVTWVMLVSLQARNPMVLYGADQLLRLMLFWAMFLPIGAAWSMDRRRDAISTSQTSRHLSMASAALLVQPCVMYFFAGLLKFNASWRSGDALGYALSSEMYVTAFGRMLAGFPDVVSTMSRAVPWIEMLAPVLLLMPWRTTTFRCVALALLVAFHLGMGCALRTGLFPAVVLVSLIPFLPAAFWNRIGVHAGTSADARIDHAASFSTVSRRWQSTVVQAFAGLLMLYVVAWNVVGLTVEEYSARHNLTWMQEWWSEGRTGVPLSFRDYAVERQMGGLGWIGRVTGLHQRWDMFQAAGPEMRGWPAIAGTLDTGERVSVLDEREVAGMEPQPPPAFYPGARWLVYFTYLRTSGTQAARELLPPVVTRDWERRNPGKKLASLEISFVQPPGSATGAKPELWYAGPASGRVQGKGL
jgi:hypothetical protein